MYVMKVNSDCKNQPAPGVMHARPVIIPCTAPITDGLPKKTTSRVVHTRRLVAAEMFVFNTATEAAMLAAYGAPPLNYDSRISCGQTQVLDGRSVTAEACKDGAEYVSWDGTHLTDAANQYISSQILTGKYFDPLFSDKTPFLLKS